MGMGLGDWDSRQKNARSECGKVTSFIQWEQNVYEKERSGD